jgi:hypothetical protein
MKKQFGCFVTFLVILIVALPVMAQSDQTPLVIVAPQMQNVTGHAGDSFNLPIGNNTVGGQLGGWSDTSFNAADPNSAFGSALAKGSGFGSQTVTPNSVLSISQTKVDSIGFTQNGGPAQVAVDGGAAQSTWAGLGDPKAFNFSSGYETSSGTYKGTLNGTGPLSGAGAAFSNGQTSATLTQGPNSAQSTGEVIANSGSNLTPMPGTTNAAAYGIIGSQTMVGVPGAFGEGDFMGTANSNSAGGLSALSSIDVAGKTAEQIGPNSVSAMGQVTSQASGKNTGGVVSTPPPCGCGH